MPADNYEPDEDPLPGSNSAPVLDDEEEEAGAGVDYRRMFKGKDKKKFHTIPKRGEKDFEPDGTNKQQNMLQEGREAMYTALSADAGLKARAATGVWIVEYEMAHIPKDLCSGPWFQTIGVGAPSGYWLLPEETLLMMSSGRLELLDEDGLEMTLLGSWAACIEPAGGVNKYLIYSHLRRAGYTVFRPGTLKGTPRERTQLILDASPSPTNIQTTTKLSEGLNKALVLKRIRRITHQVMTALGFSLFTLAATLLRFLPQWLISRPHRPYDHLYASLPAISTFSESFPRQKELYKLQVDFEVWRPSPTWRRKSPGPPNFHVCVLDARQSFPRLAQLEELYNTVASRHPLGPHAGKIILAVVDNGVSNYLSLDHNLLISPYNIAL